MNNDQQGMTSRSMSVDTNCETSQAYIVKPLGEKKHILSLFFDFFHG